MIRNFFCKQTNNQMFDDHVTGLRQRVSNCKFGDLCNSLMKNILLVGRKDLHLKEPLLWELDITLRKVIQAGQAVEETKRQPKKFATSETPEMNISLRKRRQKKKPGTQSQTHRNEGVSKWCNG